MRLAGLYVALLTLAGCVAMSPQRTDSTNPTVSYTYAIGQQDRAAQDAARYCSNNYDGRSARPIDDARQGGGRIATFECVVPPRR